MVATAIIGGVSLIGTAVSASSASKASDTASTTAANNNALQKQIYDTNAATLSPYEQTGNKAGSALNSLLGLSSDPTAANAAFDAYKGSTEYQSRLTQGQNSVTAALGSKGLLDSGAGQKALLNYGQTAASNEFGNYAGYLQGQQQTGLAAASAQAGVGQNYANAVSANNNAASNVAGNAALSQASSVNSALGNITSAYGYSQGLGSSYDSTGDAAASASLGQYASDYLNNETTNYPIRING